MVSYVTVLFVSATGLSVILTRGGSESVVAGLMLTYALTISGICQGFFDIFIAFRAGLASLERLLDYTRIEQEAPYRDAADPPTDSWPSAGAIDFDSVCLRYRPELPLSLDKFSAAIAAQHKVGIVGRSGAGKSTLVLGLFRLVEICGGTIRIDGRSVREVGLHTLRQQLMIIPQEPLLYQGDVAHNLDPFRRRTEDEMRAALRHARLPEDMLAMPISKGGTNVSAGQRQLLCFARSVCARWPRKSPQAWSRMLPYNLRSASVSSLCPPGARRIANSSPRRSDLQSRRRIGRGDPVVTQA